jgi:hypothetical protein
MRPTAAQPAAMAANTVKCPACGRWSQGAALKGLGRVRRAAKLPEGGIAGIRQPVLAALRSQRDHRHARDRLFPGRREGTCLLGRRAWPAVGRRGRWLAQFFALPPAELAVHQLTVTAATSFT